MPAGLTSGNVDYRVRPLAGTGGTESTGQDAPRTTRSAVVPRSVRSSMLFPWVPITIMSALPRSANLRITWEGIPNSTRVVP